MGGQQSVNHTILGQELLDNVYQTTVPSYLVNTRVSNFSDKFLLTTFDMGKPINYGEFVARIPKGITFKVVDVEQKVGIDSGRHLKVYAQLLDNITIHKNDVVAFDTHCTLGKSTVNPEDIVLLVKDIVIEVSIYTFFNEGYPIDLKKPLDIKDTLIWIRSSQSRGFQT